MNFDQIRAIHFVGIGGIGMSGIAEILADAGLLVSGCDARPSTATEMLAERGIPVSIGHDPAHMKGVDLVVVTAAIRGRNEELAEAVRLGIPVRRRAEILGEIARSKRVVGVAGTHGKTTTSAMIATVLIEAGFDPTIVVGCIIRNFGTNARRGAGDLLVAEADEYDRSFHHLHPEIAVVTNVEADHLEYYGTFDEIAEAFHIFLEGIAPGGVVIGCADEAPVRALLDRVPGRVIRYGLGESADVRAGGLAFAGSGSTFSVEGVGAFRLAVPGEHNVRNALAAIAVGLQLGILREAIAAALAKFQGVDRRFQILGDYAGAIVIDDYAHHPTEIRATIDAARRGYPGRRIVALFQPHLYSRTRDLARDFAEALSGADIALVAPVYAAREEPIAGVSARMISEATGSIEFLDRTNGEICAEIRRRLGSDDLFITMGAGDVNEVAQMLVGAAS